MLKTYLLTHEGICDLSQLSDWLSLATEKKGIVWVDLRAFGMKEIGHIESAFNLHPVEVESLKQEYTRPHLVEYPDHLYVNFTFIETVDGDLNPHEFHVFVGQNFIITASNHGGGEIIDQVLNRYRDLPALVDRGSYYTLYLISDLLSDTYIHLADDMDDQVDSLEDAMSDHADRKTLQLLFLVKRKLFDLRRYLAPQRDVFNELARGTFCFIDDHHEAYFQDSYNRMSRVFDVIDTSRDILSGTLDLYQSSVSNRLNDIMKVLTILAVILGVFSFLTGYLGMNVFRPIDEPLGRVVIWSIVVGAGITGSLMYFFRRKGWL